MDDKFDGGDRDSLENSTDITEASSDEDNDASNDIPTDIPEDIPDSGMDVLAGDASSDIQENILEDVSADKSVEIREDPPGDILEDISENSSTYTTRDSAENRDGKEPLFEKRENDDTLRDDIKDNPEFIDENGDVKWPENSGFEGEPQKKIFTTGEMIDLYGDEDGFFTSPLGTPYEERSLPYEESSQEYHAYQVETPFDVLEGKTTPAFNQEGGGVQQKLPDSARNLVHDKFLKRI